MLGSDVMRVGEEAGHEMTGFARSELDIADATAVERGARRGSDPAR